MALHKRNVSKKIILSGLVINMILSIILLTSNLPILQDIVWTVRLLLALQVTILVTQIIASLRWFHSIQQMKNLRKDVLPRGYRIEQYLGQQWQQSNHSEHEIFTPTMAEPPMMELDEKTRKIIRAIQKWDNRKRYFNTMTLDEFLGREFGLVGGKPVMPTSSFYNYREKYYKFLKKDEKEKNSSDS